MIPNFPRTSVCTTKRRRLALDTTGPPLRRDVDPNEVQGRWHAPWHLEFSTSSRPGIVRTSFRRRRLKKKNGGQGENVQKHTKIGWAGWV